MTPPNRHEESYGLIINDGGRVLVFSGKKTREGFRGLESAAKTHGNILFSKYNLSEEQIKTLHEQKDSIDGRTYSEVEDKTKGLIAELGEAQ